MVARLRRTGGCVLRFLRPAWIRYTVLAFPDAVGGGYYRRKRKVPRGAAKAYGVNESRSTKPARNETKPQATTRNVTERTRDVQPSFHQNVLISSKHTLASAHLVGGCPHASVYLSLTRRWSLHLPAAFISHALLTPTLPCSTCRADTAADTAARTHRSDNGHARTGEPPDTSINVPAKTKR